MNKTTGHKPEVISSRLAESASLLPAFLFALGSTIMLLVIALWPPREGMVATAFPPDWTNRQIMTAVVTANAKLIGRSGRLVLVTSANEGLPGRLIRAGAYVVVDPSSLNGCGKNNSTVASYPSSTLKS